MAFRKSIGLFNHDFSTSDQLGTVLKNNELTLKVASDKNLKFSSDNIKINGVAQQKTPNSNLYILDLDRSDYKKASIYFS